MSYSEIRAELKRLKECFAQDVFNYLDATGRSEKGRAYFGVLSANNPNLVARLEAGKTPSLDVMVRVWDFMEDNPAPEPGSATDKADEDPEGDE